MKIPVLIVSGFLGAGKTTCIQRFLADVEDMRRVMIIENDFGAVSLDAAVLKHQGARLQTLTSGCICCSLAGDFLHSLQSVLAEADVDFIVIEPSGVAKLSDILRVCRRPELQDRLAVVGAVTVVDSQKGLFYLRNFGEFFADQVACSNTILLTRTAVKADWYDETIEALRNCNHSAPIIDADDSRVSLSALLMGCAMLGNGTVPAAHGDRTGGHEAYLYDACCADTHDHHHHAEETGGLTAVTAGVMEVYTPEQWRQRTEQFLSEQAERPLRIKGIVPTPQGYAMIQYSGGPVEVVMTPVAGQTVTVIGTALEKNAVQAWWQQ